MKGEYTLPIFNNMMMDNQAYESETPIPQLQPTELHSVHLPMDTQNAAGDIITTTFNNKLPNGSISATEKTQISQTTTVIPPYSNGSEKSSIQTQITDNNSLPTCRPQSCVAARRRYNEGRARDSSASPWHTLKTVFLVSGIVLLIVWIIVYTVLNKYSML